MAQGLGFVIDVRADIAAFERSLSRYERDSVPFWTAAALTQTAKDIQAAEVAEMGRVFDRPTRYTLNALRIKPATKTDQVAAVLFKDEGGVPAWKYLGPQVEGGPRKHKSFELRLIRAGIMRADEFAVPGIGARRDAYGNLSGGEVERILSQVGAAEQFAGYTANVTKRSQGRNRSRGRYFPLRPDWAGSPLSANLSRNVPPGIYHRAAGANTLVPVLMFVRSPSYRKRLDFYGIAKRVMQQRFAKNFQAAMARWPHRGS